MATYKVNPNGSAPKDATAGDFIVTGGGTYKVLDSEKYKGMDATALKGVGVSYNPNSGLYSSRVNSVTSGDVVLQPTAKLDEWKTTADAQTKASIDSAYQKNISNLGQTYNTNKGELLNQTEDVKQQYLNNMLQHKEDTYTDMKNALYGAEQRGMMNSAQGQAMTNAGLWDASRETSQLSSERDYLVNQIKTKINSLSSNYNLGLSELEKSKLSAEIDGLNENKLQYLATMMDIDKYNTDAVNQVNLKNVDQAHQKELLAIQLAASGGGGSGGGSGYRAGTGVSYGDEIAPGANTADMIAYISSVKPDWEKELNKKFMLYQLGKLSKESLDKAVNEKFYKIEKEEVQNTIQNSGTRINEDGKTIPVYTNKKDKTKPSIDEILYKNKGYVGFGLRGY